MNLESATTPFSTSELIANQLRQSILRGELKSEQPLRQDKLASAMGVSKVPLREALALLKAEGLVIYKTNRGAFVTSLSAAEASEIYLMRIALESIALEHALPKLAKTDIARAKSALLFIDAEDNPVRWAELNWQFHAAIFQAAQMPHLLTTLAALHTNVGRYMTLYLDGMDHQAKSQAEHYQILDACIAGDLATAQRLLTQHLQDASHALENYLANQSQ